MTSGELNTDLPGWPKKFRSHEKTADELIRQIFSKEGEPIKSFDELLLIVDDVTTKLEAEQKEKNDKRKSPILILARMMGRRNIELSATQELLASLKKAQELLRSIAKSLEEQTQKDAKTGMFSVPPNKEMYEKYQVKQAVANQMLAQILYVSLNKEHESKDTSLLAIFLTALTKYHNWFADVRTQNLLQAVVSGARAQSGLTHSLREIKGINIFPDYKNDREILEWDVRSGADFMCYINGKLVIIDCKGKQSWRDGKPFDTVKVDSYSSDIDQKVASEAQKYLNLKQIKTTQIDTKTGTNIIKLTITVPTHSTMMNHLGKLDKDMTKILQQEIEKLVS